jgi:spore germination protein YaaH
MNRKDSRVWLSAIVLLALLVGLAPQPAQAAVQCATYYTVKEGDTTPYISHTFGFKWKDIAQANDMNPADKLEVGTRLCIPPLEESTKETTKTSGETGKTHVAYPEDNPNAQFTVSISGGRIFIYIAKFNEDHNYLVKARDAYEGSGGWEKLEYIQVEKNKTKSLSYNVPDELEGIPLLSVCLKDQTSDELLCRNAVNP